MRTAVNIGRDNSLIDRYIEQPGAGDRFIAPNFGGPRCNVQFLPIAHLVCNQKAVVSARL
jgi:hypothetical protein